MKMRKRFRMVWMCLFFCLLFCTACQRGGEPSSTAAGTQPGTTDESDPGSEEPSTSDEMPGSEELPVSEESPDSEKSSASEKTTASESEPVSSTVSNQEAEESTAGSVSETQPVLPEPYLFHVDELGVDLEIPGNLYVYETTGIYMAPNRELIRPEFTKWLLITDKEYTEEYLAGEFAKNLREESPHLIFAAGFTPKELHPLCVVCRHVFPGGDLRVTGSGYCEVLDPSLVIDLDPGSWVGSYKYVKEALSWQERMRKFPIEEWESAFKNATKPTRTLRMYGGIPLGPDSTSMEPYQNTMANEVWWKAYCQALDELNAHSENYSYPPEQLTGVAEEIQRIADSLKRNWPNERVDRIYTDDQADRLIRAAYHADWIAAVASLGMPADDISLNDTMVVLQDWDNGLRSYLVYRRSEDDPEKFNQVGGGFDYFVDLEPSYEYLKEHQLFP